jgi:DNA-binding CsgD family transcriptional regulator
VRQTYRRRFHAVGQLEEGPVSVDQTILSTIDTIYAAAADESLWTEVIRDLLGITESQAVSFCVLDASEQPKLPIFSYLNIEPRSVDVPRFLGEYLEGGMAAHDPTVQYIVAHPDQKLIQDSAFISEPEKDRHFYYDWHGKYSDTRHRMAAMVSPAPRIQSGITLHRTRQKGNFNNGHIERFQFLLPHIERAVRIGFRLGTFGATQRASLDVLDGNSRAIIILDRQARVLFANRAALNLVSAQDGIILSPEGLSLQRRIDDRKLQQLIGEALAISENASGISSGVMHAYRPSGKRPFSVFVSPLSQSSILMTVARPAVCVLIADPERQDVLPENVLRKLFGLTPAETRLAVRLARGDALLAVAAELEITYATARTQLGVIFRKTGTRRQGELIKLLLSDVPSFA